MILKATKGSIFNICHENLRKMNLNFWTIRFGKHCQIFALGTTMEVMHFFYASLSRISTDAAWKCILNGYVNCDKFHLHHYCLCIVNINAQLKI